MIPRSAFLSSPRPDVSSSSHNTSNAARTQSAERAFNRSIGHSPRNPIILEETPAPEDKAGIIQRTEIESNNTKLKANSTLIDSLNGQIFGGHAAPSLHNEAVRHINESSLRELAPVEQEKYLDGIIKWQNINLDIQKSTLDMPVYQNHLPLEERGPLDKAGEDNTFSNQEFPFTPDTLRPVTFTNKRTGTEVDLRQNPKAQAGEPEFNLLKDGRTAITLGDLSPASPDHTPADNNTFPFTPDTLQPAVYTDKTTGEQIDLRQNPKAQAADADFNLLKDGRTAITIGDIDNDVATSPSVSSIADSDIPPLDLNGQNSPTPVSRPETTGQTEVFSPISDNYSSYEFDSPDSALYASDDEDQASSVSNASTNENNGSPAQQPATHQPIDDNAINFEFENPITDFSDSIPASSRQTSPERSASPAATGARPITSTSHATSSTAFSETGRNVINLNYVDDPNTIHADRRTLPLGVPYPGSYARPQHNRPVTPDTFRPAVFIDNATGLAYDLRVSPLSAKEDADFNLLQDGRKAIPVETSYNRKKAQAQGDGFHNTYGKSKRQFEILVQKGIISDSESMSLDGRRLEKSERYNAAILDILNKEQAFLENNEKIDLNNDLLDKRNPEYTANNMLSAQWFFNKQELNTNAYLQLHNSHKSSYLEPLLARQNETLAQQDEGLASLKPADMDIPEEDRGLLRNETYIGPYQANRVNRPVTPDTFRAAVFENLQTNQKTDLRVKPDAQLDDPLFNVLHDGRTAIPLRTLYNRQDKAKRSASTRHQDEPAQKKVRTNT